MLSEVKRSVLSVLHPQAQPSRSRPKAPGGCSCGRARGWIMPEADIVALLRLINERISSPKIEVRHRDTLLPLRGILRTTWIVIGIMECRESSSLNPENRPKSRAVDTKQPWVLTRATAGACFERLHRLLSRLASGPSSQPSAWHSQPEGSHSLLHAPGWRGSVPLPRP